MVLVPQTDTGGWGENPKASGTMFVKELGKKAGVPSVYTLTPTWRASVAVGARSERPLPTVYQKLRSVLKRKLMYTG